MNEAQKYIFINDDGTNDLIPIQIWLPKPPKKNLIAGYDLPKEKQKWQVPKIPERLKKLEKDGNVPRSIDEIWQILETNPVKYAEEINFIKNQWYFRLYGYWFYNNGTPTYITGKHFFYLCYFTLDVGKPKYFDRDRKYWLSIDFFEKDTWDFVNKDKDGNAIQDLDENGKKYYAMYDTGHRVCMGDVYPKFRREGATYRAQCALLEELTRTKNSNAGIQSRDSDDAKKVFQKQLVPAWKKLPFFFKPIYSNSTDPKEALNFDNPAISTSSKNAGVGAINTGLESYITFGTGKEGDYDGYKLLRFHDDEIGKCVDYNIIVRNEITKECLSVRGEIIGYTSKTSTVGEMEAGGGANFETLCKQSNFYCRSENGMTSSGLYVHFISSREGYKIDEYGNSLTEESEKALLDERKMKLSKNDLIGWNELVRKFPLTYRECFTSNAAGMGFNIYEIEKRMNVLRFTKLTRRGNFIRSGDINSKVVFIDNENGRFIISEDIPDNLTNRKFFKDGNWYPQTVNYIAGGDTFMMGATEGSRRSNGGGAVFKLKDQIHDIGDVSTYSGHRFVCTYSYRPGTTDEYCDDMLKMCQYFGAMMFAETNISNIVDNFKKWGYAGYLLYALDKDGKLRSTPGMHSGENSKQELMLRLANYIDVHGSRERHIELLNECKTISSIKKMKDFDLLVSAGLCLSGVETGYWQYLEKKETKGIEITDWFAVKYN